MGTALTPLARRVQSNPPSAPGSTDPYDCQIFADLRSITSGWLITRSFRD